jgi:hypothetical protein
MQIYGILCNRIYKWVFCDHIFAKFLIHRRTISQTLPANDHASRYSDPLEKLASVIANLIRGTGRRNVPISLICVPRRGSLVLVESHDVARQTDEHWRTRIADSTRLVVFLLLPVRPRLRNDDQVYRANTVAFDSARRFVFQVPYPQGNYLKLADPAQPAEEFGWI